MAGSVQFRATTNGLGGAATATIITSNVKNNVFSDTLPADALAGSTRYRAIDIYNNGDATLTGVAVYYGGTPSTGTVVHLALEASPVNSATAIADEKTAPTVNGSFVECLTDSRLNLPDIPAGSYVRVWEKLITNAGTTNLANDGFGLTVEYA